MESNTFFRNLSPKHDKFSLFIKKTLMVFVDSIEIKFRTSYTSEIYHFLAPKKHDYIGIIIKITFIFEGGNAE